MENKIIRLVRYQDFDTTIFEDESETICLDIDGIKIWTTPKTYRNQNEEFKAWENSKEYKELEFKRIFGK